MRCLHAYMPVRLSLPYITLRNASCYITLYYIMSYDKATNARAPRTCYTIRTYKNNKIYVL